MSPTPTASEIWQQILAAPADKSLRVPYVEALERENDERARVFRLAEIVEQKYYGSTDRNLKAVQEFQAERQRWQATLGPGAQSWNAEVRFGQGWPIEMTIAARDFAAHAAAILRTLPIRHLNLKAVLETPEVFEVPEMERIASIAAGEQPWSGEAIHRLANSPYLQSLRWLNLARCNIQEAQVHVLATSQPLRQLEYLELYGNPTCDPVDAADGYGIDGADGHIVRESIGMPEFGRELEAQYGRIEWLHPVENFLDSYVPSRYWF